MTKNKIKREELFSLDYTFAVWFLPRIEEYIRIVKEGGAGTDVDDFLKDLKKIRRAMKIMIKCDGFYFGHSKKKEKRIIKGLQLFAENIRKMWY